MNTAVFHCYAHLLHILTSLELIMCYNLIGSIFKNFLVVHKIIAYITVFGILGLMKYGTLLSLWLIENTSTIQS